MLLSVHIPKTGGVSFRNILKAHYAGGFAQCYWEITDAWGHVHAEVPPATECLHGHYVVDEFAAKFPDARCVTWVRDPVERVISSYHHRLRDPDLRNPVTRRLVEEHLSLADFVELPSVQNEMAWFLGTKPPAAFDFVGITERFDHSLATFCHRFGLPPQAARHDNSNPTRLGPRYAIDPALRRHILALNARDDEIYRHVLEATPA